MAAPKGHPNYNIEGIGRPKKYTDQFIDNEAKEFIKWMGKPENIFYGKFCFERGYPEQRFDEWRKTNQNLSDALDLFKTKQKFRLLEGSLVKKLHYNTAALVLSHSHGIHLTTKTENETKMSLQDPFDEALIKSTGKTKDLVKDADC